VNDSQIRERIIAKREEISQRIAKLEAELANQKLLLSEMNALLEGVEGEFIQTPIEAPYPELRRRGRPRSTTRATKQPRPKEPYRRLSVAKSVLLAIQQMEGEFTIGDLVDAIYEIDEETDTRRVKIAITNEVSDLHRRGESIVRVRRGVYRRLDTTPATESNGESVE